MAFTDTTSGTFNADDGVGARSVIFRKVNGYPLSKIACIWFHGSGSTGASYESSRVYAHPDRVDYFPTARTLDVGTGETTRWATPEDALQNSGYDGINTERDLGLVSAISERARLNGAQWVFGIGHSSGGKMAASILSNGSLVTTAIDGVGIDGRGFLNAWVPDIPMDRAVVFTGGLQESNAFNRVAQLQDPTISTSRSYYESVQVLKFAKQAENPTIHRSPDLPFVPYFIEDTDGAVQEVPIMTLQRYADAKLDILIDHKGHTFSNDANYRLAHILFQLLQQQTGARV